MSEKIKKVSSTVIWATASISVVIVIAKYRKNIVRKVLKLLGKHKPLELPLDFQIVSTQDECTAAVAKLSRACTQYPILGFDCEWVTGAKGVGPRNSVALLQLATFDGFCALFRLNQLRRINPGLQELLSDDNILKIGVAPQDDARKIAFDYGVGVGGTMDLRYMAYEANQKPGGLAKMAHNLLGVELDKHWRVICSDWEQQVLTQRQIEYAARDAIVAVELFKRLAGDIEKRNLFTSERKYVGTIIEICTKFIDIQYRELKIGDKVLSMSGCTNGTKNLQKALKTPKHSTREKPLYDNCIMTAPDGEVLCTCDKSKAKWYVAKGLAKVIVDEPYTIQLTFEPSGRAVDDVGRYYTIPKENQCVVCGKKNEFIRKNVVPREYRKFFPEVMKNHSSHDILLLCLLCHQVSNMADYKLRDKLAKLCEAPIVSKTNVKMTEITDMKKMKSVARALYNKKNQLPAARREELEDEFLKNFAKGVKITDALLERYIDVEVTKENLDFIQHGEQVVKYFTEKGGGIVHLEKMWREHFIASMRPKFMPELWSVNHNQERLEIRAEEGRVDKSDLKLAGVEKSLPGSPSS